MSVKKYHNKWAYMYNEKQGSYWIYVIPFTENTREYKYYSQKCDSEIAIKKLLDELINSGAYNSDSECDEYDENIQIIIPYKNNNNH